jgi:hypothetical protein
MNSEPMLDALRNLVEEERRRNQKRMWIVMALYLVAFLCLFGVVLYISMLFVNRTTRENAWLQREVESFRQTLANVKAVEHDAGRFSEEAVRLRRDLTNEWRVVDDLRSDWQAQTVTQSNELARLRDVVSRLEGGATARLAESADTNDVKVADDLRSDWQVQATAYSNELARLRDVVSRLERGAMARLAERAAAPPAARPAVEETHVPPPGPRPRPDPANSLMLTIVPAGGTNGVAWRLPIPQE